MIVAVLCTDFRCIASTKVTPHLPSQALDNRYQFHCHNVTTVAPSFFFPLSPRIYIESYLMVY